MHRYSNRYLMSALPIVSCEEYKCVIIHSSILECLHDLPHPPVQLSEGVTKWSTEGCVGEVFPSKLRLVGMLKGKVEEEGSP